MLSRVLCQRGGAEDGRSLLLQPETAILCLSHTRSRSSILAASATVQIAPASWQVADPLLVSCRSPSPAQGGLASMGATMQAAAFDRFGGPDVLHVVNWTKPHPSADRVLVRVICASVNPVDVKIRQGQAFPFSSLTALPKIPGGDVAGIVEDCADNSKFGKGDKVYGCLDTFFPYVREGCYAQYVAAKESHLAKLPEGLGFEEAAGVPLVALTAWQGLEHLPLPPGSRALIHGGSGGVGSMAIQVAKKVKGWHVTTTCSPRNAEYCRQLGADEVVDYSSQLDLSHLAQDRPFDVVLDVMGGDVAQRTIGLVRRGGHYVSVWTNAGRWIEQAGGSGWRGKARCLADVAYWSARGLLGLGPRHSIVLIQPNGQQLEHIAALIQKGSLRPPRVGKVFPLAQASEAQEYFEKGQGSGKVILRMGQEGGAG